MLLHVENNDQFSVHACFSIVRQGRKGLSRNEVTKPFTVPCPGRGRQGGRNGYTVDLYNVLLQDWEDRYVAYVSLNVEVRGLRSEIVISCGPIVTSS